MPKYFMFTFWISFRNEFNGVLSIILQINFELIPTSSGYTIFTLTLVKNNLLMLRQIMVYPFSKVFELENLYYYYYNYRFFLLLAVHVLFLCIYFVFGVRLVWNIFFVTSPTWESLGLCHIDYNTS